MYAIIQNGLVRQEYVRESAVSVGISDRRKLEQLLAKHQDTLTETGKHLLSEAGSTRDIRLSDMTGKTEPQIVEALVMEGYHGNHVFLSRSAAQVADIGGYGRAFQAGCDNGCNCCLTEQGKQRVRSLDYTLVAKAVWDYFVQLSKGRYEGIGIHFGDGDTDALSYRCDKTEAYLADSMRFYQKCSSLFGIKPKKKEPIRTSGYRPDNKDGVERTRRIRALNLDPELFEVLISYKLFRNDVEAALVKVAENGNEGSLDNLQKVLIGYANMYIDVISSFRKARPEIHAMVLSKSDEQNQNFPKVLKAIHQLQSEVWGEIVADVGEQEYYLRSLIWDSRTARDTVQRLVGIDPGEVHFQQSDLSIITRPWPLMLDRYYKMGGGVMVPVRK